MKRTPRVAPSICNRMKRVVTVTVFCLIAIFGIKLTPVATASYARGLHAQGVPLESLPATNTGVDVLSVTTPGHYRGTALTHGVQLWFHNGDQQQAEFRLQNKYETLTGTVYGDDKNIHGSGTFTIYNSGDANHKKALFTTPITGNTQVPFHISVRGVSFLYLEYAFSCCNDGAIDVVAAVSNGTSSPKPSTQVIPRYPTNGAGVAANSKVLFGWQPFPHATSYAFHIWLVGLSGSASLTSSTPFSFSASIYHKTSYTWDDHGFLPGTYQYSLLPLDDQGHNLAGWSTPTQITIAS